MATLASVDLLYVTNKNVAVKQRKSVHLLVGILAWMIHFLLSESKYILL